MGEWKQSGSIGFHSFSVELKDSAGAISQSVAGPAANAETQLKFTRKLNQALETFTFTIDPDNKVIRECAVIRGE